MKALCGSCEDAGALQQSVQGECPSQYFAQSIKPVTNAVLP